MNVVPPSVRFDNEVERSRRANTPKRLIAMQQLISRIENNYF